VVKHAYWLSGLDMAINPSNMVSGSRELEKAASIISKTIRKNLQENFANYRDGKAVASYIQQLQMDGIDAAVKHFSKIEHGKAHHYVQLKYIGAKKNAFKEHMQELESAIKEDLVKIKNLKATAKFAFEIKEMVTVALSFHIDEQRKPEIGDVFERPVVKGLLERLVKRVVLKKRPRVEVEEAEEAEEVEEASAASASVDLSGLAEDLSYSALLERVKANLVKVYLLYNMGGFTQKALSLYDSTIKINGFTQDELKKELASFNNGSWYFQLLKSESSYTSHLQSRDSYNRERASASSAAAASSASSAAAASSSSSPF
jgi:hypothetical protein